MRYFKAEPGTQVLSCDHAGNVWPEPLVFDADGYLGVPDDQQDVIAALEGAVGNGAVSRAQAPPRKGRSS